jgi:hypothetical protein
MSPNQANAVRGCGQLASRLLEHGVISVALVLGQASGCVPDVTARNHTVRDSVGVQIVENVSPSWAEHLEWQVDTVPDLDLSGQEDERLVRPSNARLLADGRIVFFNGGACEVHFYSPAGQRLGAVGRCGRGPGEFEEYASLWLWRGDSVFVVDQLMRVTVLGSDGSIGRVVRLPTTAEMPVASIRGVLADETLVLTGLRDPGARPSPGVEAAQSSLALLRGFEDTPQFVGSYPGPVFEYTELNGRIGRNALAFSSSTQFAAGGDRVFVGLPDRYEIHAYAADGTLQRIIRRPFTPVKAEQRDIDWLMERRLAQVEGAENQRIVRQAFRDLKHAEAMPAFGPPTWPGGAEGGPALIVDAEGNLWVFVHYRPGEYRNDWTVFSADGVWLGTVALPGRLTPSQIEADHVIGSWSDDTGFVHIRRHRITKR